MNGKDFSEVVDLIVKEDSRFDKAAYFFVRRALDHTLKSIKGQTGQTGEGKGRHITGQELLEGIREFALEQYGPMTLTLLEHWGVRQCADFGEIVFNLVEYGVFGKTEHDSKDDFKKGYDFREVFWEPFMPQSAKKTSDSNSANGKRAKDENRS